ncbi:MAG: hypothetical protein NTW67_06060 [Candidatus Woesearchaeota archaeon]|nr:hypothetical protein [Candidatus Woesearchaeota archaeon]
MKKVCVFAVVLLLFSVSVSAFSLTGFFAGLFSAGAPVITNTQANPIKVYPGQSLNILVAFEDDVGIKEAVAFFPYEGGYDRVGMILSAGNEKKGTYSATWVVHNTENMKWYETEVVLTNVRGGETAVYIDWQDPLQSHPAKDIDAGIFKGDFAFNGSLDVYGGNNINPSFPDGLNGTAKVMELSELQSYTVPTNKTLYILTAYSYHANAATIWIDSLPVFYVYSGTTGGQNSPFSFNSPLIVPGGSTVFANESNHVSLSVTALEVNSVVTAKVMELSEIQSYTVPTNKTLYILTAYHRGSAPTIWIDSLPVFYVYSGTKGGQDNPWSFNSPLVVPSGSTVFANASMNPVNLFVTGYER